MGTIISLVLGIIKAVPIIDKWFSALVKAHLEWKILKQEEAYVDGIKEAIDKRDTRKLEEALGHPNPGAPSEIRNGIRKRKKKK